MQLEQIDLVKYQNWNKLKSYFTLGGEARWEERGTESRFGQKAESSSTEEGPGIEYDLRPGTSDHWVRSRSACSGDAFNT